VPIVKSLHLYNLYKNKILTIVNKLDMIKETLILGGSRLFVQLEAELEKEHHAPRKGAGLAIIGLMMAVLVSCAPIENPSSIFYTKTPTLIPPYIMTQQEAFVDSQATQLAGEAQIQNLNVQATRVALEMIKARATATAVQQLADSAATATAGMHQTQVAAQQQTSVAGTQAAATHAAQTQMAFVNGFSTMTPLAATAQAVQMRVESDRQSQWFTTWASRVATVIAFGAVLVALFFGGMAFWDGRWALLARMGLIRWGPDGKPYWVAAFKGGVALLDISRGAEPAVVITMGGDVNSRGGLEDKAAQAGLAHHAQMIEQALVEGTVAAQIKLPPISDEGTPRTGLGRAPAPQIPGDPPRSLPTITVLSPNDPKAKPWVEDAVRTVLDDSNVVDDEVRDNTGDDYE
jgi:hypothetical protein